MARYALVEDGKVTNVVEWNGESAWPFSDLAVPDPERKARTGGTWDGRTFSPPPDEPTAVAPETEPQP